MQGLNGRMRPCESLQMFGAQMVKLYFKSVNFNITVTHVSHRCISGITTACRSTHPEALNLNSSVRTLKVLLPSVQPRGVF